jgi:hypothetical protein
MRKTWIAFLLSGLFFVGSMKMLPVTAEAAETMLPETMLPAKASEELISGKAYLLIQTAMNEFKGRGLDISRYRIIVEETEASRFVLFIDADATEKQRLHVRGSPGKIPAFEVELEPGSLRIIRSNFVR